MRAPTRGPAGPRIFAAFAAALLLELAAALALAPASAAFDPGQVASTANDPAFNISIASQFRLNLENLTACAWTDCRLNVSDDVKITIDGPDRLTGTFAERYRIAVSGVPAFAANYTTIAVVLKGNTSDVVIQTESSAERSGSQAYTKDVNGSSTMNLTLLPSNRTGNLTMVVFGYVGNGSRTTHADNEVYQVAEKKIRLRAQRVVPVNVTVANDANVSLTGVLVHFYAKGPFDADFVAIGNTTVNALNAKGSADAGIAWDVTWADPAVYMVKVVVDPYHQHADAFEDNNILFFEVNLGPPESDTRESLVGTAFVVATVAIIGAVGFGLWWYNRYYE